MPRLEDWRLLNYYHGYQTPDSKAYQISGVIYEDEFDRFIEGECIRTSTVQTLDIKNRVARTKNTQYILGEPDADYVKWLYEKGVCWSFDM